MEPRLLATFEAVAAERNFSRAAEALGYAQSSVTAQIQALERELGTRLFERLGRRVLLTASGERLLAYAARLRELADEARQVVGAGHEPAGVLTVGATESLSAYRLPPVLAAYHRQYPAVELVFRTGACADLKRGLAAGALDLAFLLEPETPMAGLEQEVLRDEPILFVGSEEVAVGPGLGWLEGRSLLLTEAGGSYRTAFDAQLGEVRPGARLELASVEAIKRCALAGMGVALLPEMAVVEELADGGLVRLAALELERPIQMVMAWHRGKWRSPAMGAFMAAAREAGDA